MGFFLLGWLADLLSLYDYVRGANSNKEYVALCRIKRLLYTFWTHPLLVLVRYVCFYDIFFFFFLLNFYLYWKTFSYNTGFRYPPVDYVEILNKILNYLQ